VELGSRAAWDILGKRNLMWAFKNNICYMLANGRTPNGNVM